MPSASERLDARYAALRADPEAPGWFSEDVLPDVLKNWLAFLSPWMEGRSGREDGTRGSAVELGCGAGNLALELAASGWSVAGFDVSPNAVAWARERVEAAGVEAEFEVRDLAAPGAIEGFEERFDLAVDSNLLHYILPPRRLEYLANARALLARGGVLAVQTDVGQPREEDWPKLGYNPATRLCSHNETPMTYVAHADEVLAELREAGFGLLRLAYRLGEGGGGSLFVAATPEP